MINPFNKLIQIWRLANNILCIARSGLFDGAWYLKQYEDVADAGINPLVHYVRRGAREGRNPNPLFNGNWYLQQYPEIAAAGENPLAHYIRNGTDEGRNPSAYFDLDWYLARNKDVKASGMHPLRHFLKIGTIQGRRPSPHISAFRRWAEGGRNENLPKLLMIDRIYPRPDQDSGSIDCINYIGLFQEFGYRVFFAADEEYNSEPEVYRALEERDVLCLNPADFLTIESFIESEIDDFSVVFLSRVYSGGRFYELIRKKNPGIKIIFNTVDLHAIREMREAKIKEDSKILKRALKTIDRERHLAGRCDATIIVSEFERKYLAEEIPDDKIVHIPLMRDCPGRGKEFSDRGDICFIGNYSHNPNTDALKYFLDEMWPLIHARLPLCRFFIIGPNLPEDIKRRGDPNVEELGHVTDLKSTLDRMRLSVAPLRYGAGVKGKVVTSLACGLPCVATDVAIEGMGLVKDQHIAVENSPPAFADCVVRLYGDRNIWEKYSTEGWRFCTQNNSLKAGRQRMAGLLESLNLPVHNS